MDTKQLVDAYNAKVAAMRPDPKCQYPEAGPEYRNAIAYEHYLDSGYVIAVNVTESQKIHIFGAWRLIELELLVEFARELMTMGLGDGTAEVAGGGL